MNENDELVAQINSLSSSIKEQHSVNHSILNKLNSINNKLSDELILSKGSINEIYSQINSNRIFNKVIREHLNSTIEKLDNLSELKKGNEIYLKQCDENFSLFYNKARNIFSSMKMIHKMYQINSINNIFKSRERHTLSQKIRMNLDNKEYKRQDIRSMSTSHKIYSTKNASNPKEINLNKLVENKQETEVLKRNYLE